MRSYMQLHLGYGSDRKTTELTSALYYEDTTNDIDFEKNEGQKTRKSFIDQSKIVELEGQICSDLTQMSRYIPNNTQVNNIN